MEVTEERAHVLVPMARRPVMLGCAPGHALHREADRRALLARARRAPP